jgi:hypothetical protein
LCQVPLDFTRTEQEGVEEGKGGVENGNGKGPLEMRRRASSWAETDTQNRNKREKKEETPKSSRKPMSPIGEWKGGTSNKRIVSYFYLLQFLVMLIG